MSNVEWTTSWQQIQWGIKEAERLITRKEHNPVMAGAGQVLEYMVRCTAERACVVEGDLSDAIGQLYRDQWTNKVAKDNYHTIRTLGDKIVHERDGTTYDVNQAFQLPTQEVYMSANEFARGSGGCPVRTSSAARNTSGHSAPKQGIGGDRGTSGRNSQRVPVRNTRGGPPRQGGPREKHRRVSPAAYILRLLIPVLLVILLIVAIRVFTSDKGKGAGKTTTASTMATVPVEPAPMLPSEPETESEIEPPAEIYGIKGSSVNTRSEPSTSDWTLTQPGNGTEVAYVKRYDSDWAVINCDSQGAYISSKYIEKIEPMVSTEGETEGSEAQTVNQARVFMKIV